MNESDEDIEFQIAGKIRLPLTPQRSPDLRTPPCCCVAIPHIPSRDHYVLFVVAHRLYYIPTLPLYEHAAPPSSAPFQLTPEHRKTTSLHHTLFPEQPLGVRFNADSSLAAVLCAKSVFIFDALKIPYGSFSKAALPVVPCQQEGLFFIDFAWVPLQQSFSLLFVLRSDGAVLAIAPSQPGEPPRLVCQQEGALSMCFSRSQEPHLILAGKNGAVVKFRLDGKRISALLPKEHADGLFSKDIVAIRTLHRNAAKNAEETGVVDSFLILAEEKNPQRATLPFLYTIDPNASPSGFTCSPIADLQKSGFASPAALLVESLACASALTLSVIGSPAMRDLSVFSGDRHLLLCPALLPKLDGDAFPCGFGFETGDYPFGASPSSTNTASAVETILAHPVRLIVLGSDDTVYIYALRSSKYAPAPPAPKSPDHFGAAPKEGDAFDEFGDFGDSFSNPFELPPSRRERAASGKNFRTRWDSADPFGGGDTWGDIDDSDDTRDGGFTNDDEKHPPFGGFGDDFSATSDDHPSIFEHAIHGTITVDALCGFQSAFDWDDARGVTPFYLVAQHGHHQNLALLIGANKHLSGSELGMALSIASSNAHHRVVELLIAAGAEIDQHSEAHPTALFSAAIAGHHRVVELLLLAGADRSIGWKGEAPLEKAQQAGFARVVALLSAPLSDHAVEFFKSRQSQLRSYLSAMQKQFQLICNHGVFPGPTDDILFQIARREDPTLDAQVRSWFLHSEYHAMDDKIDGALAIQSGCDPLAQSTIQSHSAMHPNNGELVDRISVLLARRETDLKACEDKMAPLSEDRVTHLTSQLRGMLAEDLNPRMEHYLETIKNTIADRRVRIHTKFNPCRQQMSFMEDLKELISEFERIQRLQLNEILMLGEQHHSTRSS